MARLSRKPSVSEVLTKPTLQLLIPRDAVAVELALEYVRNKGTIQVDVVQRLLDTANAIAEGLGWQKPKKSAKQVAEETIDGIINQSETE
jgi:hypothetical protein